MDIPIDPALLLAPEMTPSRTGTGELAPKGDFEAHLLTVKRKEPFQAACGCLGIRMSKKATLGKLRAALVQHWYPDSAPRPFAPTAHSAVWLTPRISASNSNAPLSSPVTSPVGLSSSPTSSPAGPSVPSSSRFSQVDGEELDSESEEITEAAREAKELIERARAAISIAPANPVQPLDSYEPIRFEDIDVDVDETPIASQLNTMFGGFDANPDDDEDEEALDIDDDARFKNLQTTIRMAAAQRTESNRRAGGKKAQKANLKCWNTFVKWALERRLIRDGIVDEHSMLMYAFFTGNRCQRDRRGEDIPNTRVGASQIKKEMFGAIRLRKIQEAKDPSLKTTRPSATVYVYDAFRTLMDEALRNKYEGLIEGEDAPDVVANTFLDHITDDTLAKIGTAFLQHRELKSTLMGHLSWVLMNAAGCRGDDLRALKLCELQPHEMVHPTQQTPIFAIVGVQSQHKAQKRSMKTTINPVYTTFVSHRNPEMCPLGAVALYLHYIYDVVDLDTKYEIDYERNKSWRKLYLIHGAAANTPYNETSLINLFAQAYKRGGINSRLKQHLARHMLAYKQERMGVDKLETSKMGWSRDTYNDVYAPSFPKQAILGAHGYKVHEEYRPFWREIPVPAEFLKYAFPMAEENLAKVDGKTNLVGAARFWMMAIQLRPILFQCAASIYQTMPSSALFRLPALSRPEVVEWMKTTFAEAFSRLANAPVNQIDLARLENETLRSALEEVRCSNTQQSRMIEAQSQQITALTETLQRRTAQWTPPKACLVDALGNPLPVPAVAVMPRLPVTSRRLDFSPSIEAPTVSPTLSSHALAPAPIIGADTQTLEDLGVYAAPDLTLRGYALPSPPPSSSSPRQRTAIDLLLPPIIAFAAPGMPIAPPSFGREPVAWQSVFDAIKQPQVLWETWKPSKSLDLMSVQEVWDVYTHGEKVVNTKGDLVAMKPPLRLVEQHFHASWRKTPAQRKAWQRLRELPEYIENSDTSPTTTIASLEARRKVTGKSNLGTNALAKLISTQRSHTTVPLISSKPDEPAPPHPSSCPSTPTGNKRRPTSVPPRRLAKKARV